MFTLPSDPNPLSGLLTAAIGGATQHHKAQNQQNELQRVLGGLNAESSPMDWFKAIESVRDPEVKANLREGYKQHLESEKIGQSQSAALQKQQSERDKENQSVLQAKKIAQNAGIPEADIEGLTPEQVTQHVNRLEASEGKGAEKRDQKLADLNAELLAAKDSLDNLDRLEKLGEGPLKGPIGSAKALIGTESAEEYNAIGKTAIQPIVKMYNPSGPIAQRKLEWIEKTFAPTAGELITKQRGKISALRRIAKQAESRTQERINFINRNKGKSLDHKLKAFDEETQQLGDTVMAYEAGRLSQESEGDDEDPFSNPQKFKGRTINDGQGGRMRSDGEKWIPVQ